MFTTLNSENLFIQVWDQGFIHRQDWEILLSELTRDDSSRDIANRLLHAVRRGRLKIIDEAIADNV